MTVLICGAGIAGLTLGLTLHQIGVPFQIFERVKSVTPLGVGINLQPTAVRELYELGLQQTLETIGVKTRDYGFYTKTGVEIWTEPRGQFAGYNWPQYSVHRGHLQMALLDALIARAGAGCLKTGHTLIRFVDRDKTISAEFQTDQGIKSAEGTLLVGADGIHSAVRKTLYPDAIPPVWGGAIMWRGTSLAKPFLSGASMILAGNDTQRFVTYPISNPDPQTGLATINWIAEKSVDPNSEVSKEDWNRQVDSDLFLAEFEPWAFEWLNIPELIRNAEAIYEYPMVDLEPVDQWSFGRATLIGDAAHATYPVGSSGASQAILDARILGAEITKQGDYRKAAIRYEDLIRPMANSVTLANRTGGGPDAIMQMAEDKCGGDFSKMDTALPMSEREAHAFKFKKLAGLTIDELNARPSIISQGLSDQI